MDKKRFEFREVHCGGIFPKIWDNERQKYMNLLECCNVLNKMHEEEKELKSDLARVIEQASKNNELCVSDIRILEKALWCPQCANNLKRLEELRKEFNFEEKNDKLESENERLKKENEKLKAKVAFFKALAEGVN